MAKMTPQRDQQIMEVFLAAIELPDDRRAGYLDKACGNDHELRQEIESLLEHHVPETQSSSNRGETRHDRTLRIASLSRLTTASGIAHQRFGISVFLLTACFMLLWYFAHQAVQRNLRGNVESQLQTVLNADVAAIELWLVKQKQTAETWAADERVRSALSELARLSSESNLTTSELESTDAHEEFLSAIGPLLAHPEITFVGVFASDGHGIAKCPNPPVEDVYWSSRGAALISPCFRGETIFMPTFRPGSNVVGSTTATDSAAISVVAPIIDESDDVIAAMQLIMKIDKEFATLFSMARIGNTGESYAFDQRGFVLSEIGQQAELRRCGLINGKSGTALNLRLQDPGYDLRAQSEPIANLSTQPMCRVPALAIADGAAIDAYGYRNYLGANVVGAARWLPEYEFGVITELEYDEAFAPLRSLSRVFATVFGLLAVAATAATVLSMKNRLLRKQVKEARQLGRYKLQELIGQGGMAKVYRATHAVLRRPTAIKLIEKRDASDAMIARFEREAQLASELTHPNTIQIYDFGRTDDGVFYFAMELLRGITLGELVCREGGIPPTRVVHILRQVCGSLAEAHERGMIHRDIKPANIMLCELGGQYDVVKVLDFGLVKNISPSDLEATGNQQLTGTPLYIAPERIRRSEFVDGRSDIYSVGTVAFYLLTGEYLFDGDSSADVLYRVVNEPPRRPSDATAEEIPAMLDDLVMSCLQKDPQDRPQDMRIVLEVLDSLALSLRWSQADARNAARVDASESALPSKGKGESAEGNGEKAALRPLGPVASN